MALLPLAFPENEPGLGLGPSLLPAACSLRAAPGLSTFATSPQAPPSLTPGLAHHRRAHLDILRGQPDGALQLH